MIDLDKALATVKNGMVALNRAAFQNIQLPEMTKIVGIRLEMHNLVSEIEKSIQERAFAGAKVTPLGDDVKPSRKKKK